VTTVYEQGWSALSNGDLLKVAEEVGYNLLITTAQNLRYQQNLSNRDIAIMVLLSTSWPRIRLQVYRIGEVVNTINPGRYLEIDIS
jgi:hypothetical protein